jgi:hypothetical protein
MASANSLTRSPRVQELMDRIRGLVAEENRLERAGRRELAVTLRVEINRLQEQLAEMVMRELRETRV